MRNTPFAPSAKVTVLFICSALLFGLFLSFPLSASAATRLTHSHAMPNITVNAYARLDWPGATRGGSTTTAISNPGLSDAAEWNRNLTLKSDSTGDEGAIGFEKFSTYLSSLYCNFFNPGKYSPGLYEFVWWDIASPKLGGALCFQVPGENINTYGAIFIWEDYNSGDLEFAATGFPYGFGCSPNPCSLSVKSQFPPWNHIWLNEGINNTFTGHNVWGVQWTQNQWRDTSNNWVYQNIPSQCPGQNGCPTAPNPPQMYWEAYPAFSSTGGILFSCVYDSGSTCQFGK